MRTITDAEALAAFAALAVHAQSVDLDRKIGAEAAGLALRTKGLYEDPDLSRLFSSLGARLVKGLGDQPFTDRFAISGGREPNAYALPGG